MATDESGVVLTLPSVQQSYQLAFAWSVLSSSLILVLGLVSARRLTFYLFASVLLNLSLAVHASWRVLPHLVLGLGDRLGIDPATVARRLPPTMPEPAVHAVYLTLPALLFHLHQRVLRPRRFMATWMQVAQRLFLQGCCAVLALWSAHIGWDPSSGRGDLFSKLAWLTGSWVLLLGVVPRDITHWVHEKRLLGKEDELRLSLLVQLLMAYVFSLGIVVGTHNGVLSPQLEAVAWIMTRVYVSTRAGSKFTELALPTGYVKDQLDRQVDELVEMRRQAEASMAEGDASTPARGSGAKKARRKAKRD